MKRLTLIICFLCAGIFSVMAQSVKQPLTNADVISMLDAKLSESTIILAIQNSGGNFDVSTQSLILLKNKGATDKILDAMLTATKGKSIQTTPEPVITKPKPKVEYNRYTFELNDCELFGTRITCDLFVTNNDKDREIEVWGSGYANGTTRIIDTKGIQYSASKVQLGGREDKGAIRANLVTGVPFKLTIIFDDIAQDTAVLSLLEIAVDREDRTAQFKNIPLTITTPTTESSFQPVYMNEFSFEFVSCDKSEAIVTCAFTMKNNGRIERDVILDLSPAQMIDKNGIQFKITKGTIGTSSVKYFFGGTAKATLAKGASITLSLSCGDAASVTALKVVRLGMMSLPVGSGTYRAERFNVDFRDLPLR